MEIEVMCWRDSQLPETMEGYLQQAVQAIGYWYSVSGSFQDVW